MKSCTIPSFDQTVNLLKNHNAGLYSIIGDQSQGNIEQMLRHSADHIRLKQHAVTSSQGDDHARYAVYDPGSSSFSDTIIRDRVTDRTARAFRKGRTEEEVKAIRDNPNNVIRREYGTAIHNVNQTLAEMYHQARLEGKPMSSLSSVYASAAAGEYPITREQVDDLFDGVKNIIDDIWKTQWEIDINQKPVIRFENVIVDPVRDEAGTMDIVAIFSDSTAMIFDYKTVSPRSAYIKGKQGSADRELISSDFINPAVQEKWKLQLSVYKRILLTYYGVKDVRATRVVPVWADIKGVWDDVTGTYRLQKSLSKVQLSRKQSEHLRSVSAGYEKTTIGFIDDLIEENYKRAERLRGKLRTLPPEERASTQRKIADIEKAILDLTEDKNMKGVLLSTAREVSEVYQRYLTNADSVSLDELNHIIGLIQTVSTFDVTSQEMIETMRKNGNAIFYDNIRDVFKTYGDVIVTMRQILSELTERRVEIILDAVGDSQGAIKREGDRLLMNEDGFFTQMFLTTSQFENPLVQRAATLFEQSYEKARQELIGVQKKMEGAEEGLRQYAKRTNQGILNVYRKMINPRTGDFYGKLSSQFYADQAKARTEKDATFFTNFYKVRDKNRFGQTYQDWYKKTREDHRQALAFSYNWMIDSLGRAAFNDRVTKELEIWESDNDLSLQPNGQPTSPDAWLRKNGWLLINPTAIEKYKSKEWAEIEAVPELKTYYDTVSKVIRDLRPFVGYDVIRTSTFLPKIRAEFVERLAQDGLSYLGSNAKGIGEDLRQMFSLRQGDTSFGQVDYATGQIDKTIPVFFTNPFKDAEGKVDISQQSLDISKSVRLFAQMAYTRKYMSEIEAEILSIKELLKKTEYYESSPTGKKIFNFMHNIAIKDKTEGGSMTDKVFNNIVDYHLYGVKVQPFQGNVKATNAILKAKNYFTLKVLGLGFIPAGASYASARAGAWLEAGKGVVYTEDQWRKATINQFNDLKKYSALGYFFGVHSENEVLDIAASRKGGGFKNPLYSAKLLQYINDRQLMRPFSYGDERIDNHIANAMAMNYGIDEQGNVRRLKNLPEGSKSILEAFSVNEKGEVTLEGAKEQSVLQFKRAVRAAQRNVKGTMNSEDINYAQTDLLLNLVMQFKTWMPGVLNERFGKLKYNDIIDAPQWGRYRALLNETEFKNSTNTAFYILGTTANTLMYLSKSLLMYNRISRAISGGSISLKEELNQAEYSNFINKTGNTKLTYADFLEIKQAQIKALVSELEILLLLSALIFSLGADWDDDGDPLYKEIWGLQRAYQVLNRVRTELTFSYDPLSYSKLVSSAIPISSLAVDAARIINNTLDETGDVLFGEGNKRLAFPFGVNKGGTNDPTGKFHYSLGIIPGGYQLRRMLNLTEQDEKAIR